MEEFSLPFPTLQYLAGHAVARRLVLMKVDEAYWYTNRKDSLRECELRVDKLPLPPPPREYVRNVLRGFFVHIQDWIFQYYIFSGAEILVDAHGNLDERRTIRHHVEKRYKDVLYRRDFRDFIHFLEHLSWHDPECCAKDFARIILNLQKVNTSLVGPEYRLVGNRLHVVFRFVNRHSLPHEFKALLEWKRRPLTISREKKDVLVTYSVYEYHHDEDIFRIHLNLLQPSQRLKFVKRVLYQKMVEGLSQKVFRFLHVLDPEMRWNCLLHLKEDDFRFASFRFLKCCLIPGYESLFIPMLKLVGLNRGIRNYFYLFADLVDKIDLIGFDSLLLQFWELLPTCAKSEFNERYMIIKNAMRKLSQENGALFQVLFDDGSASPTKRIRHALDE